jgi:prefoldin subunit 5
MSSVDAKTISIWVGLAISLSGIVATWSVMQYRLEEVEKQQEKLVDDLQKLSQELNRKGDEVRCLICKAHEIQCPGC